MGSPLSPTIILVKNQSETCSQLKVWYLVSKSVVARYPDIYILLLGQPFLSFVQQLTNDQETNVDGLGDDQIPLLQTISTEIGLSKGYYLECSVTALGVIFGPVLQNGHQCAKYNFLLNILKIQYILKLLSIFSNQNHMII